MMDFTLPGSAQAVAALAAGLLPGPDPWKALARAGLLDATALTLLDITTLLTEIGKRAPSLKAHATLMTGALPLARWGHSHLIANRIVTNPGHDHGVALVSPSAAGVTLTRTPSSSGEPEYTLRMDHAPVEGMLGGADCVRDLYQLATAGACALADGAVAGALDLTREHVATRRQFGRPLAAFQAVSQQIADVYIASRTMHLAVLAACWKLDAGLDASADVRVAGYWCAARAPAAVRICHHLHGGLGMDATYPLHRFSSLVADLVRYLGGTEYRLACLPT